MVMAAGKTHDYHILNPSSRPILMSFAALAMAAGAVGWMHKAGWGDAGVLCRLCRRVRHVLPVVEGCRS